MEARIDGITSLFSRSIGIEEPWYIQSIESKNNEVHIYVDVRDGVNGSMETACFIRPIYTAGGLG